MTTHVLTSRIELGGQGAPVPRNQLLLRFDPRNEALWGRFTLWPAGRSRSAPAFRAPFGTSVKAANPHVVAPQSHDRAERAWTWSARFAFPVLPPGQVTILLDGVIVERRTPGGFYLSAYHQYLSGYGKATVQVKGTPAWGDDPASKALQATAALIQSRQKQGDPADVNLIRRPGALFVLREQNVIPVGPMAKVAGVGLVGAAIYGLYHLIR